MEVDARVLEVSNEKRRISISIKDVEPINPMHQDEMVHEDAELTHEDVELTQEDVELTPEDSAETEA